LELEHKNYGQKTNQKLRCDETHYVFFAITLREKFERNSYKMSKDRCTPKSINSATMLGKRIHATNVAEPIIIAMNSVRCTQSLEEKAKKCKR